jgi:hypothetical protein
MVPLHLLKDLIDKLPDKKCPPGRHVFYLNKGNTLSIGSMKYGI